MNPYLEIARKVMKDRHQASQSLEAVLAGRAVELWSDAAGRFWIAADEADAKRLMAEVQGVTRGEVYTASEVRRVISIADPAVVGELHQWKRMFDGTVRAVEKP